PLFALALSAYGQTYLNLGFEGGSGVHPVAWLHIAGVDMLVDSNSAYEGRQSLRLRSTSAQFPRTVFQRFPVPDAAGKHMRVSGYVKTENVGPKGAGVYLYVYGANGRSILSLDDTSTRAPAGTHGWMPFVIDRDVSRDADIIDLGCTLK